MVQVGIETLQAGSQAWLDWEDLVAAAFPSGIPAFDHADAQAMVDILRARLLWPFPTG